MTDALIRLCERPISEQDRARAVLHVLDWLGCALAAQADPMAQKLANWFHRQNVTGCVHALGSGRAGAEQGAFVNGGLGSLMEMDDLHCASILHVGDVVVPASLAQAQALNVEADKFLDAVLMGYEVALRIGCAAASNGYSHWYNSATCGVFGAAMAASHLLGLNREGRVDALGQAGMQASGIWQCRLESTDSKQLATAHAARSGLTSAALADAGCAGAREILEGQLGFFATYYPDADRSLVLQDPHGDWRLHEVSFKPWPACRHTHPLIHLGLGMHGQFNPNAIRTITIKTYEAGQSFCDNANPTSAHEARFSLQHCLAVSLLRGSPTLEDFEVDVRNDPCIAALRNLMRVEVDETLTNAFPQAMGAGLNLTLVDGITHDVTTEHAPGDPQLPLSRKQLVSKFVSNATHAGVSIDQANKLVQSLECLPGCSDLSNFNTALSAISIGGCPHG